MPESEKKVEKRQKIDTRALKEMLSDNFDIVFGQVVLNNASSTRISVVYAEGLIDIKLLDENVLKPLICQEAFKKAKNEKQIMDLILSGNVHHGNRQIRRTPEECVCDLSSGSAALVFDRLHLAVTFPVTGYEKRAITEPSNENVLKGSKESFSETLLVNTSLIRRRIKTGDLTLRQLSLGERTKTNICLVYINGIANPKIIKDINKRLESIDIDSIISVGQIEGLILENRYSPFPEVMYTERVDKFCANILEGRVGILIDGFPMGYYLPIDINSFFQAPEDYALNYILSSIFRLLRYLSTFISLTLPALYVSMTTFHQEMLPTDLALAIISSRQGVPFPSYVEVALMLLAFEVLLEAGLRLPRAIGQAVTIFGALVVGDAAITARILSPGVVIAVSAAGLSGFVVPHQDMANVIRLSRFLLVVCATIGGLFTVSVCLIAILYHLCSLETYGVAYLSPFVAGEGKDLLNDTFIRSPWVRLKSRPKAIKPQDLRRQGE